MNEKYEKFEHDLLTDNFTDILIDKESIEFNSPVKYIITKKDGKLLVEIPFQKGPIKCQGVNGVFMEDLLAICVSQLKYFQNSVLNCQENQKAIEKIEEAMMYLRKRTANRIRRKVQGLYEV